MTPTRLATVVLFSAVLLPISPNVSATCSGPTEVVLPIGAAVLLEAAETGVPAVSVVGSAADMTPEPVVSSKASDCKCLYFDWWYDTGGLWVQVPGSMPPDI